MKRQFFHWLVLSAAIIGLASAGCAKRQYAEQAVEKMAVPSGAPVAQKAALEMDVGRATVAPATYQLPEQGTFLAAVSARKVITTAYLTVKVADVVEGYNQAQRIAQAVGGFVESSRLQKGAAERERRAELVLRIPATRLEEVVEEVGKLGEVLDIRREGKDVTHEWVDLDSRIRNLKREEEVLLDIMGRRARNLTEVLEVERELARVRGEIEQSEGRLRSLSEQVALATLHLELVETEVAVQAIPAGLWRIKGTASQAARVGMRVARGIVGFLIWIGILGIVWVPALGIYLGVRYSLTNARRRAP